MFDIDLNNITHFVITDTWPQPSDASCDEILKYIGERLSSNTTLHTLLVGRPSQLTRVCIEAIERGLRDNNTLGVLGLTLQSDKDVEFVARHIIATSSCLLRDIFIFFEGFGHALFPIIHATIANPNVTSIHPRHSRRRVIPYSIACLAMISPDPNNFFD